MCEKPVVQLIRVVDSPPNAVSLITKNRQFSFSTIGFYTLDNPLHTLEGHQVVFPPVESRASSAACTGTLRKGNVRTARHNVLCRKGFTAQPVLAAAVVFPPGNMLIQKNARPSAQRSA